MMIGKDNDLNKVGNSFSSLFMMKQLEIGYIGKNYINDDSNKSYGSEWIRAIDREVIFRVIGDDSNSTVKESSKNRGYDEKTFKFLLHPKQSLQRSKRLVDDGIRLSFQLMTRAEPAAMVIETIKSLIAIKAADDEILIVDNNHTDVNLYQPLAEYCAALDTKLNVHFYHVDAVVGFKAGALNLALGLMNPMCTHVVVVDSDYQALPHARASIASAIQTYPNHALLQFPQFYRDSERLEVHSELNHYFNYHLYRDFNRERALSTGTYAVIQRTALIEMGGWSGASITEDAQMGVLMHRQGLQTAFIPKVIATGLLPNTVVDLMSQRRRWIYGNMQVLNTYFDNQSLSKSLSSPSSPSSFGQRLGYIRAHLSQLSAWVNLTGIFIVLHICTLLLISGAMFANFDINLSLLLTPLYAVYAGYALFLSRRLWAYCHDDAPLNQQMNGSGVPNFYQKLRAWLMHINFWELGALSWLPVLWGREKPFICTPKQVYVRSRYTVWTANIAALPKLLIIINLITILMVSPLSPLYSPLIFVCAMAILILKLWSAWIMLENYAYSESNEATATADFIHHIKSDIDSNSNQQEHSVLNHSAINRKLSTSLKQNKVINS